MAVFIHIIIVYVYGIFYGALLQKANKEISANKYRNFYKHESMSWKKCVFIMCYMYLVEGTARFSCVKKYLKADLGQSHQLPIIVIRV